MKIKTLLLGAGLFLAALATSAKPHDPGDVDEKWAHGSHGSFADGVRGNEDRKHDEPPLGPDSAANFEAGARDVAHHDFHGAVDATHEMNTALSHTPAVPEPQTYVLMLAGLGAVGLLAIRRKLSW